jgi:cell division protein FtsX
MVKVENKETLRLLTKRFMKMNRARNIIAVIAIMLTSLLFTSLFVGSVSMILSKRATEIKQFMDSSHAIAQNLSEEDAERLQKTIEQSDEVDYLNMEDPDVFSHRAWELEYQRKQEMRQNQPARTKKKSYDIEL